MSFPAHPPPRSPLDRHRQLAPTASVRVSPLCLGAMNFGDAWKGRMGECNKDTAFEILVYFISQGGNFIDTANPYQNEESETWLGEWMASRKIEIRSCSQQSTQAATKAISQKTSNQTM